MARPAPTGSRILQRGVKGMSDGWHRNARGNLVKRWGPPPSPVARSDLACPMIASDYLPDGTYSGADGKAYSSKAALRASYLPSGNPKGIRYEEIGNETQKWEPPKADRASIKQDVAKAIAQVRERNA